MEKMYLISWCDDNHAPHYWLETEYLGTDILTVVESAFGLGQCIGAKAFKMEEVNITGDNFPEDNWEQLFDYFQTIPEFDDVDIKLIIADKWQNFYEKNIKKIRRKVLTNK